MAETLLKVSDLQAWYGESHILHGVGFEIGRGELVTLLGRNGVGKTTTLRSVMGIVEKRTGTVTFDGRDTIRSIIRELAASGCAVVLATHELDEAERLANHVVIFDHGTVVADSTLEALRRGHDEIRFRSSPHLDTLALAAALGMVASRVGDDEYVIDAPPHPRLLAQLTSWLADQGHPLIDMRAGGQRLEDVFRRLTRGEGDAS